MPKRQASTALRLAALLVSAATLASAGDGHIILRKHVASQPCVIQGAKSDCIVEGQETDIVYSVYNVGESAAYGVTIVDASLSDGFDLVGELNGDVGEIAGCVAVDVSLCLPVVAAACRRSSRFLSLSACPPSRCMGVRRHVRGCGWCGRLLLLLSTGQQN